MNSGDIICPYWRGWFESLTIRCEGFVDHSELRMRFESRQARVSYEKAFCERMTYWRCPICRAVEEVKYGDDEDE